MSSSGDSSGLRSRHGTTNANNVKVPSLLYDATVSPSVSGIRGPYRSMNQLERLQSHGILSGKDDNLLRKRDEFFRSLYLCLAIGVSINFVFVFGPVKLDRTIFTMLLAFNVCLFIYFRKRTAHCLQRSDCVGVVPSYLDPAASPRAAGVPAKTIPAPSRAPLSRGVSEEKASGMLAGGSSSRTAPLRSVSPSSDGQSPPPIEQSDINRLLVDETAASNTAAPQSPSPMASEESESLGVKHSPTASRSPSPLPSPVTSSPLPSVKQVPTAEDGKEHEDHSTDPASSIAVENEDSSKSPVEEKESETDSITVKSGVDEGKQATVPVVKEPVVFVRKPGVIYPGDSQIMARQKARGVMEWMNFDATTLQVRDGPDYKTNKTKTNSLPSFYDVVAVDGFHSDSKIPKIHEHLEIPSFESGFWSRFPNTLAPEDVNADPSLDVSDTGVPQIFVINVQIPTYAPANPMWGSKIDDGDNWGIIVYMVLSREGRKSIRAGNPAAKLLEGFMTNLEDESYTDRMKGIVRVEDPSILPRVAKGYNAKPFLTRPQHFYFRKEHFTELLLDVHIFSYLARRGFYSYIIGNMKEMAVHVAFVIEAREDEEMPEQVLNVLRINQYDMSTSVEWDEWMNVTDMDALIAAEAAN